MKNGLLLIKDAVMSLRHRLGFVFTVITTMGITLGAFLCIATLNYLLLVKPLSYSEQQNMFVAEHKLLDPDKRPRANAFTYPGLVYLYENQSYFDNATIIAYKQNVISSIPSQPTVNTGAVTPEFTGMFDMNMYMGRSFSETEALNNYNPVTVISYQTWQGLFGSDPEILSKTLMLAGIKYRIIGVAAKDFKEPQLLKTGHETQVWLPWDFNSFEDAQRQYWGNVSDALFFVGAIKPNTDMKLAEQQLSALVDSRWQQEGIATGWSIEIALVALKDVIMGDSSVMAILLLGGVTGLVLISCVNLLNLFMSRTVERQTVLSIHAAIGAKKSDLFKLMFAESGVLLGISTVIALVIASFGFMLLGHYLNEVLPRANELSLSLFTFVIAVVSALSLALFFAKVGISIVNYKKLKEGLQSSGKGTGVQVSKRKRKLLIISQVGLVTSLVLANITLFQLAIETIYKDKGFNVENKAQLSVKTMTSEPLSKDASVAVMRALRDRLEAQPQIASVSQAKSPVNPFSTWAMKDVENNARLTPLGKKVDQNYFAMIEQTLVAGRLFDSSDIQSGAQVMIVNEAFAEMYGGSQDVIGKRFTRGSTPIEVVGVVEPIFLPSGDTNTARVYMPESQSSYYLMLQFKAEQLMSRAQIATIVSAVDSRFTVFNFDMLSELHTKMLFGDITAALTSGLLTILILFLAAIGLYGTLSYNLQLRKLEIGTRRAIGAKKKDLYTLMIGDTSQPVFVGLALGSLGLFILWLTTEVNSMISFDSMTIGMLLISVLMIILISLFACCYPLKRLLDSPIIYKLKGE
ncbi:ABC transporter permease [Pseudoalteromonas sp. SCSIO 43201]|uniref:ABC transporter permease n=1 Tax=Pseudoalteromonas sp. SCSIO 43201 TaxID=2822842 RepID=UPI002075BCEE|nr:ABC transporter permease [Pseudoalteromonas sp. SCSIO 43201]USD28491.1 ABC transporter permease [Pseudoalteromonas sp. SCSIO 43201]